MRYYDLQEERDGMKNRIALLNAKIEKIEAEMESIKENVLSDYLNNGVVPEKPFEIRRVPSKLIVIDESRIPEKFIKVERKIDKKQINECSKLGEYIEGVTLDNGGYTVAVR
jgi:hypothetical protein